MNFQFFYLVFCFATLLLSYILNGILVVIVHKKRARVGFYRHFTYAFVLVDILYASSFTTAQPFWYAGPGVLAFFSIAPWNENFMLIKISYQIWFAFFVAVLLIITSSFLYRYGLLCSPFMLSMFERPSRFFVTLLTLALVCTFWLVISDYVLFHDSEDLRRRILTMFGEEFITDFEHGYMLTVDLSNPKTSAQSSLAAIILTILLQSQLMTMAYCGWKIHKTITTRAMSDKLKTIHRRALSMLIAQTMNPLIFFFVPSFINTLGMFSDTDFGALPKVLASMFGVFPILNPVIVIYFTQDYRRYVFGQPSSIAVVSQGGTSSHRF